MDLRDVLKRKRTEGGRKNWKKIRKKLGSRKETEKRRTKWKGE